MRTMICTTAGAGSITLLAAVGAPGAVKSQPGPIFAAMAAKIMAANAEGRADG